MVQFGVPASYAAFGVFALLWPTVRLYRRTGQFAFVAHRGRDPSSAAAGASFVALVLAGFAYCVALAVAGPAALGVIALPLPVHAAGLGLCAVGIGLCATAQAQMGASWRIGIGDAPTALVSTGLYGFSRHPIYSALLVYVLGFALAAPSLAVALAAALTVGVIAVQARLEERHLLEVHGEAYRAYARKVGRFVPGLGRL